MSSSNKGAEVYATASLTGELYRGGEAGQVGVRHSTPMMHVNQPATNYQTTTTTTEIRRQSYKGDRNVGGESHVTGEQTVESVRKISSVVLESTPLQELPKDKETYIDVPKYEEEIIYVPVKEVKEIVKTVPVYDVVYVDREVRVPRKREVVEWIDTPNYVIKEVMEPERPAEPLPEREKYIEVPGKTIYKDRRVEKIEEVVVQRFLDHEVPVIVAQTAKPTIPDATEKRLVEAQDYQPEITFVDVHLTRPVDRTLELVGVESTHKLVALDAAHYNTLLRKLNAGSDCELPYVVENGRREFVSDSDISMMIAPPGIVIEGWMPKTKPAYPRNPPHHATETATATHVSGAFEGSVALLRSAPNGARLAAAPPQSLVSSAQHSQKAREVQQQQLASDNSSVSSSINKIASEINMGHKKSGMCCGSRSVAPSSGAIQLTYPSTMQASVSTDRQRGAEAAEYQSLHTSPQQPSHAASTYSKSFRPVQVRARAC